MNQFKIRIANKDDAVFIHDIHTKAVRVSCANSYSKTQIDDDRISTFTS